MFAAVLSALAASGYVAASIVAGRGAAENNPPSDRLVDQESSAPLIRYGVGAEAGVEATGALVHPDPTAPPEDSTVVITYTLPSWGSSGAPFTGVITVTPEHPAEPTDVTLSLSPPLATVTYTLPPSSGSSDGFTGTVTVTPENPPPRHTSVNPTPSTPPKIVTYTLPPGPGSSPGFTGIITVTPSGPPIHATTSTSVPESTTAPAESPKTTPVQPPSPVVTVSFVTVTYTLPSGQGHSSTAVTFTARTTVTDTLCPSLASSSLNHTALSTGVSPTDAPSHTTPLLSTTGFGSPAANTTSLPTTGVPPFTNLTSTPPAPTSVNGTISTTPPFATGTSVPFPTNATSSITPIGTAPSDVFHTVAATAKPSIRGRSPSQGSSTPVPALSDNNPEFIVDFDDMPHLQVGNSILPIPISNPYHGLWFSSNFSIVDHLDSLYKPSSGSTMVRFGGSGQSIARIGGPPGGNPCIRFNVHALNVGCDAKETACTFTAASLRWNGTASVMTDMQSYTIPACNQSADCSLEQLVLDPHGSGNFDNITAMTIFAMADADMVAWWADDIRMSWVDGGNSAACLPERKVSAFSEPFSQARRLLQGIFG